MGWKSLSTRGHYKDHFKYNGKVIKSRKYKYKHVYKNRIVYYKTFADWNVDKNGKTYYI